MPAYGRAHVFRNATIKIEDTEYANQLTKAELTPDVPIQTLRTLVPDGVVQDADTATWTLALAGVQDRGAGSLGKALDDAIAAGDDLEIVIQPKVGTGQDVATCTIKPVPIPFGGEQGSFRTHETNFPVVGQPAFSQSV